MRSEDGGVSWADHRPGAQRDVHSVVWHQRERGRAYEAGGGGAAFSVDAGESWTPADEGRDRDYTWAVATDPSDPDLWWLSASTGRSPRTATVTRRRGSDRRDDGEWTAVTEKLEAMPYALAVHDGRLFAALGDGTVIETRDGGDTWSALRAGRRPAAATRARVVRRHVYAVARSRTSCRAASAMCSASIPAACEQLVRLAGVRQVADRELRHARPSSASASAESTASPSPPSGQWSSTVTIGPSLGSARSVSASIGLTE